MEQTEVLQTSPFLIQRMSNPPPAPYIADVILERKVSGGGSVMWWAPVEDLKEIIGWQVTAKLEMLGLGIYTTIHYNTLVIYREIAF